MTLSNPPARPASAAPANRAMTAFPEHATKAVELLTMRDLKFSLTKEDAAAIVSLMLLVHFPNGATLFKAGDATNTGYMLLVLEGDVSVDTGNPDGAEKVDISVIGPGALIGELALLDSSPRSATCTAVSAVVSGVLTAAGLQRLLEQHPQVAAKLVIYIAQSASDRLRSLSDQLQMYDGIIASMQTEMDQLRVAAKRGGG